MSTPSVGSILNPIPHLYADYIHSKSNLIPVGTILPFAGNNTTPSGFLLCDGREVSRAMYPDLFSCIGTLYGDGDGTSTFNLPDLRGKFVEGDETSGTIHEAGLPNITGGTGDLLSGKGPNTNIGTEYYVGAIRQIASNKVAASMSSGSNGTTTTMDIDASRSSAIYGNSTTVQPPAITFKYFIKAFDDVTVNSALIDITQYANDLSNKANKKLSNLDDEGKSFSFPSDTYVDITSIFNTNNATYTAPADGYLYTKGMTTGDNAYLNVGLPTYANVQRCASTGVELVMGGHPIRKGQIATLLISNVTISKVLFAYTQGEVPE